MLLEKKETCYDAHNRHSKLWHIREVFVQALAPLLSRSFNITTGSPIQGNSTSLEKRLVERAWDSTLAHHTDGDDMSFNAFSEADTAEVRPLREHIKGRGTYCQPQKLTACPSLSSMMTWKNFVNESHSH